MSNPKVEPKVAYICDGFDKCSFEPGCYKREDLVSASDVVCRHTFNPDHALNGPLDEIVMEKLDRFVMMPCDDHVTFYEKLPEEEL